MSWLQIAALVVLVVSGVVGEASRLAARQEAQYLKAKRADDPRLDAPETTLHPAPDLDLMWGSGKGLPATLGAMTRLHRAAMTIAFVAGAVLLLTLVFGK